MKMELLIEAERRGILPPEKAAALNELRRRGKAPLSTGMLVEQSAEVPNTERVSGAAQTLVNILGEENALKASSALKNTVNLAGQGANLGNTYLQGRTFGVVPKTMSAIGALPAKAVLEGREFLTGNEAPSYADLYKSGVKGYQGSVQQSREDNPLLSFIAEAAGGLKTGRDLSKTKAGEALSNWRGQSGWKGRALKDALFGEAAYRAYKVGTSDPGQEAEELVSGVPLGGILGGATSVLGSGSGSAASKLKPKISSAKQDVADLAKKYNIPLGLDDLTDSKFYKTLVSEGQSVPFSGAASKIEKQQSAFNRAVAKSIGLTDDRLTPENMNKAYEQIGKQFDDLTKGKTFDVNDDVLSGLDDIRQIAEDGGFGESGQKQLDKYLKELYATINEGGTVKGESLAKLRSRLNRVGRQGSDQNAKALASQLENVISDFISDGAPESLKKAKYQYKNFITLEPLAQKSQVEGYISPALLSGRVSQVFKRQFTRGQAGELGDLARIGQLIKQEIPNSGTAQRQAARALVGGGVPEAALAVGSGFVNPALPLLYYASKGAGLAANRAIQNMNYPTMQATSRLNPLASYLSNYAAPLPVAEGSLSGLLTQ